MALPYHSGAFTRRHYPTTVVTVAYDSGGITLQQWWHYPTTVVALITTMATLPANSGGPCPGTVVVQPYDSDGVPLQELKVNDSCY